MLCKNCGAQLPDGARFCLMCGAAVEAAAEPVQADPVMPTAEEADSFDFTAADGPVEDDATDVTGTFRVIPAAKKLEEPLNIGAVPFLPMAPAPRQTYVPRRVAHPVNQSRPGSVYSKPNVTAPKMQEFNWPENSSWAVPAQVDEVEQTQKPKKASLWSKLTARMAEDPQPAKEAAMSGVPQEAPAPTAAPAPAAAPAAEKPFSHLPKVEETPAPAPAAVPEPPAVDPEPVEEWPPVDPVQDDEFFASEDNPTYQDEYADDPTDAYEDAYADAGATAQFSMPGTYAAKSPDQTDNLYAPATAARTYRHTGHVTNTRVLVVVGILVVVLAGLGIGFATGAIKFFDDGGKDYTQYIRAEETPVEEDTTTTTQEEPTEEEKDLAVAGVTTKASVEDYTWEELSAIAKAIASADSDDDGLKIAASYNLCDSKGKLDGTQFKEVKLTNGTTLYMRIAGFRQDDLADGGRAGITFIAANSAGTKRIMEYEGSNSDWENSALREWMNKDLLAKFPDEVTDVIQDAEKATNASYSTGKSQGTTTDTLWIPSVTELYGTIPTGYSRKSTYTPEGEQYALFADQNVTWGAANEALEITGTTDKYWWTRTPDSESAEHNICVSTAGSDYSTHVLTTDHSVVVGFCL